MAKEEGRQDKKADPLRAALTFTSRFHKICLQTALEGSHQEVEEQGSKGRQCPILQTP